MYTPDVPVLYEKVITTNECVRARTIHRLVQAEFRARSGIFPHVLRAAVDPVTDGVLLGFRHIIGRFFLFVFTP